MTGQPFRQCKQPDTNPVYNGMGTKQTRFEALVQALSTDLYRYAVWLCRDRNRAEELVQETFLRAWRSLDTLRDERAAKGWLITILRREHARGYERYRPDMDKDIDPDDLAGLATSRGWSKRGVSGTTTTTHTCWLSLR
ncbi:MAG: sigma factor [Acidiferrobacterales bacterium]|nr:sigma factor [Acidiferrobacterales bacterium]